jgi:hypothetical protein
MNNARNTSCHISSICQIYSASVRLRLMQTYDMCHIPVISTRSVKDDLSALVSVHMLRMCLWHAWSVVCWLFHCFFDCLKALNENCTYVRHIPLQINHMSDIICYNELSNVTAELIIFLLFKLQCPRLAANGPAGQAFRLHSGLLQSSMRGSVRV